ncbi:MAG: hypothetical protein IRY83_10070 [Chloroflexi bacterium]|nr:hypothetical protein [Chloroflexota bacterium]
MERGDAVTRARRADHPVGQMRRCGTRLLSAVLAVLLLTWFGGGTTARAAGASGVDVSFPNCGQPLPTSRQDVVIVGVEGGRPFTTNPCLAEEFRWASAAGRHYEVYINTAYPSGTQAHRGDRGPRGTCPAGDLACRAYNFGFNNAEFAYHYAQSQYAVADTWWLDVETANTWSDNPALNVQAIQGAIDSLRSHHLRVGIYSIPSMWRKIAGTYTVDLPKWTVRLTGSVPADAYCAPENGFGGGAIAMVQEGGSGLDRDIRCPVDPFASQADYVPFPLVGQQFGELFGTRGGAATYYALPAAGRDAVRAVTLDFAPSGADVANALFLSVVQDGRELASIRGTDTPTPGHLRLEFTARGDQPVIVRLQTYNAENTPPISYTITPG